MEYQKGICTFCLEKDGNCGVIKGNILCILLPNIDFTPVQEPVTCRNCAEMLIKCCDFKKKCLYTYKSIVPLVKKNSVKLDLKDVYLSKNGTDTGVPEDQDICGFCLSLTKKVSALSFNVEEKGFMLEKMIKQCLPELDLSTIKTLVICAPCFASLENCFHFVTNCLNAKEKIKEYCETLDVDCKGEIQLSNVLQFTIRDVTSEVDCNSVNKIKVEQQFCGDRKNPDEREINNGGDIIKLHEMFLDVCKRAIEETKIKNEIFIEMDDEKGDNEHQFTSKNMLALEEESYRLGFIKTEGLYCKDETEYKEENLAEMKDQTFLLHEEIEIKTEGNNVNRFEDSIVLPQGEVTARFHREQKFLIQNLETKPNIKEALRSKSFPAMHKCYICLYQTKHKYDLTRHLLTHKDLSEITTYKCLICLYQTNRKGNLKIHLLKHKDPSERTMYKCDCCSFQTGFKCTLKRHLLSHKDPSEVTMYKCDSCSYQTRFKSTLRIHLQQHKDPSEVVMYKCHICLFQSKSRKYLKVHLWKHKDPSEVPVYKCVSCSYQTKYKGALRTHLLLHKDPSEVTMYKCDSCLYKTKFKGDLKRHSLIHKHPSEITMYKCDTCVYQTNRKNSIKKHLLKH